MTHLNSLNLADLAGIIQPLVDELPGPIRSVDLNRHGTVMVHTSAKVTDFPDDQVWGTNISPTYVTHLNIRGIDVMVFAEGEPYTRDGKKEAA